MNRKYERNISERILKISFSREDIFLRYKSEFDTNRWLSVKGCRLETKVSGRIAMRHGASLCSAGQKLASQLSSSCIFFANRINTCIRSLHFCTNDPPNEWNSDLITRRLSRSSAESISYFELETLKRNQHIYFFFNTDVSIVNLDIYRRIFLKLAKRKQLKFHRILLSV